MNLPFLQKAASSSNKFLSVNINSSDIKCLVFYYDSGSYKIIGSGKEDLEKGSVRNGVIIDKDDVIRALKSAVLFATEDLEEKITDTLIGTNGDLCLGLMTTVRFKRPSGGPIKQEEIEILYDKVAEAAYIQAQNEYLENTGNPDVELETITTSDVYIKIDNQLVTDLENKEGQIIEAAVFNAFSPAYHIKALQDVARKAGLNIIAIGSEMYAISQWIKQYSKGQNDFVLMSVESETTNAAAVFGGGIVSTKNLNIGFVHFVEGISEKMGITAKEAGKLLRSYIAGKLSESEAVVVHNAIMEILDVWLSGLELLFGDFTNVKTFAPKIYLTGYGAEIKDLVSTLKSEPWAKSIPFKSFPEISKLNFSDFNKISDSTGKVGGPEWLSNIGMAIIYEEIIGEK